MANIFDTITIEDFKNKFKRDFQFVPYWIIDKNYFIGNKVYYIVDSNFYTALTNNIGIIPTTNTDWQITQDDILNYVSDEEIQSAFDSAKYQAFYSPKIKNCLAKEIFLFLVAHLLYTSINFKEIASLGGRTLSSRSVGDMSESFSIPSFMQNDISWVSFKTSPYGIKYATLIEPYALLNAVLRFDTRTR